MKINKLLIFLAIAFMDSIRPADYSPQAVKEQEELNDNLIKAAQEGIFEDVQKLLKHGADFNASFDKDDSDEDNAFGQTPLMEAVKHNHIKIVELLLNARANVNAIDKEGYTALMWAANNGHIQIVELLLKSDADTNIQNKEGRTALMRATSRGYTEIVKLLLDAGADINRPTHTSELTLLMTAACHNNAEILKLLLDAGEKINTIDKDGNTALMLAASNGQAKIVKLLLNAGTNVNAQNKDGNTSLILAAQYDRAKIVELLLNAGAEVNIQNKNGDTAETKGNGNAEIVKLFNFHKKEYLPYLDNDNHIYDQQILNNITDQIPGLPRDLAPLINGYARCNKLSFSEFKQKKLQEKEMEEALKIIEDNQGVIS